MASKRRNFSKSLFLYSTAVAVSLAFLTSCFPGPDFIYEMSAFSSSDGALHVLARKRTSEQEGGGWGHVAFLYARQDKDGTFTKFVPPVDSFGGCCSDDMNLKLIQGEAGMYMVIPSTYGLSTWLDDGTGFKEVSMTSLSQEARSMENPKLIAVWQNDDTIYVLTRKWLYFLDGASYTDAYSVSGDCVESGLCYAIAGDGSSVVAKGVYIKFSANLSELTCDEQNKSCVFADTGETLGSGDYGGGTHYNGRYFFRTINDSGQSVDVFVRNVKAENPEDNNRVLASSEFGDFYVLSKKSFAISAAPLPAGGYVVAILEYGGTFSLAVVTPDLKSKRIFNLNEHADDFMGGFTVACSGTDEQDQRVHVLFGSGSSSLRHLTVNPGNGEIENDNYMDF